MWSYVAAMDPQAALSGAIYLGFPETAPLEQLLTVSKPRRQERPRPDASRRGVLQCLAFAAQGVDLKPVLEGLITQARPAHGVTQGPITTAVAAVALPVGELLSSSSSPPPESAGSDDTPVHTDTVEPSSSSTPPPAAAATGTTPSTPSTTTTTTSSSSSSPSAGVTMILRGLPEEQGKVLLERQSRQEDLQRCDVAVFVFDGTQPNSFRSAVEQMVATASASGDTLPCVMLCLNEDQLSATRAAEVGAACSALEMRLPLNFPQTAALPGSPAAKSSAAPLRGIFQAIVQAALKPEESMAIPVTPSLKATMQYRRMLRRAALVAAGGTVAGLTAYLGYRWYQGREGRSGGGGGGGTVAAAVNSSSSSSSLKP